MKLKGKLIIVFSVLFLITLIITFFWGRNSFRDNANKTLSHAAELKTLEFTSSLGEQLTLVRQMIKSPSIANYLAHPDDEIVANMAMQEFGAFQNSFLSKSIFWVSDADLVFWQDMKPQYNLDPNDPASYWYKMTMYETEEYNFNINYNPDLNITMLWVNAVIRNDSGTPVGIAGTGIPLSDFISSMYAGLPKGVTQYLYNDDLTITGAADQSILANQINLYSVMPDLRGTEAKPVSITSYSTKTNQFVLGPLDLVNWHMAMSMHFTAGEFFKNALTPLAICLVVIIIGTIIAVAAGLVSSITTLKNAVDELSSGNADLTKRVALHSDSLFAIISRLVTSLNAFIQKLQGIVANVKLSNGELVATGNKLKSSTEDTSSSITEIITTIRTLGSDLNAQAKSVEATSGAVSQISSNISSLNTMIASQVANVSEASGAVQEMIGNINSVNGSVGRLSQSFTTLQTQTELGVAKQKEVNTKIMQIKEQSEALKNANQVIQDIAEQTNLLAMNAAIEAAHAGEAGKGFSVVADEIRKLSENSSAQSKTIGNQLQTIQDSVLQIVTTSQESRSVLGSVSEKIRDTNTLVQEINNAMEEQKIGSEQILQSLKQLNDSTQEVKSSSKEMATGNKAILSEMGNLEGATGTMKNAMRDMLSGAEKISDTGKSLSDLTFEMDKSIMSIGKQLDQFKA